MNAEMMSVGQLAAFLFVIQAAAMGIGVMLGYAICKSKRRGLEELAEDRGYERAKRRYAPGKTRDRQASGPAEELKKGEGES